MIAVIRASLAAAHRVPRRITPPDASTHPGLAFLPPDLRARASRLELDAGEILFRTGDRPEQLYFVVEGELLLVRHSRGGQQVVLQRARAGFLAEASIESRRYHCDGVAKSRTIACAFPMAAFRQALADEARFRAAWTSHLAREIRRLRAQCECLALRSAPDRIVHYIESEGADGAIALTQPLKSWALDLGLTHEALYRAIARMKRSGEISVQGLRLTLSSRATR
jgi:CRP-like cAMP-binding protein